MSLSVPKDNQKGNEVRTMLFRFRDGALDAIARAKNLTTETQLAAALSISESDLDLLRHGAAVGAPMALHVGALMGTNDYMGAWFEQFEDSQPNVSGTSRAG